METVTGTTSNATPSMDLRIEKETRSLVIRRHDAVISATNDALLVHGLSETPVYYVPRKDVYMEHLVENGAKLGPRGLDARFWSVAASGGGVEDAVWMFVSADGEFEPLMGHCGFDPDPFNITVG